MVLVFGQNIVVSTDFVLNVWLMSVS